MSRGDMLGHGAGEHTQEMSPRLVEALVGKTVVGVTAGDGHTAAWTEEIELFTFGRGDCGQLGHGGGQASMRRGWSKHYWGRRWSVQRRMNGTQQRGPMQASSSPLGMDAGGVWAMEGQSSRICRMRQQVSTQMSMHRGWLRHWWGRR